MGKLLTYFFFRLGVFILRIIPVSCLFLISDFIYIILRYVIKYRYRIVYSNIRNSFPDYNEYQIKKVIAGYYRNLSDVFIETIKGFSFSKNQTSKFVQIVNPEILEKYFIEGRSCVLLTAHLNNWEWFMTFGLPVLKHKICAVYKPIHNPFIDKYLLQKRKQFGLHLYSMEKAGFMVKNNLQAPSLFVFISDQSPGNIEKAVWTRFLGRDTAVIAGAEQIAKRYDLPVFFLSSERIKRGNYSVRLELISENSSETKKNWITQEYMSKLEHEILVHPCCWLWSHKRWKHTKNSSEELSE